MQVFPLPTVHSLRKQGCKIRVYHWRYVNGELVSSALHPGESSPKGGKTQVTITLPDDSLDCPTYTGEALCSLSDCFNRKRGVQIALGRALKYLNLPF